MFRSLWSLLCCIQNICISSVDFIFFLFTFCSKSGSNRVWKRKRENKMVRKFAMFFFFVSFASAVIKPKRLKLFYKISFILSTFYWLYLLWALFLFAGSLSLSSKNGSHLLVMFQCIFVCVTHYIGWVLRASNTTTIQHGTQSATSNGFTVKKKKRERKLPIRISVNMQIRNWENNNTITVKKRSNFMLFFFFARAIYEQWYSLSKRKRKKNKAKNNW